MILAALVLAMFTGPPEWIHPSVAVGGETLYFETLMPTVAVWTLDLDGQEIIRTEASRFWFKVPIEAVGLQIEVSCRGGSGSGRGCGVGRWVSTVLPP